MSATDKDRHGRSITTDTIWLVLGLAGFALLGLAYGSLYVGYRWAGLDTTGLLDRVKAGQAGWVPEATYAALAAAGVLTIIVVVATFVVALRGSKEKRVDRAVPHMASEAELADIAERGRKREAREKGLTGGPLPRLARTPGGHWLRVGPESTATFCGGPRSGKTTTAAVTRIVEWPQDSPLIVTSNKRDILDLTRRWRSRGAARVWAFDPQGIVGETPSWYWDPISYVRVGGEARMDIRAARLAHRFAFSTSTHTKGEDYFNATGEGLVAALILACAVAGRNILDIRAWLTDPDSTKQAAELLRARQFTHAANALEAIKALNPDQRDGVFGTADTMTRFLTYRSVHDWVTPGRGRTEFDMHHFARSGDTLYSISREGQGSMGPLVTALTAAVCEAAEDIAQASPAGRLERPLGLVLDEVANVCRWSDLPDLYSHYGSKGIIPIIFLQSWSQGANVWGDAGMKALWSASTTRIIGPGIAENGFLESVSHMIGDYTRASYSTSRSERGGSTSVQGTKDTILTVADLTALPFGRAILVEAGHRAALVHLVPWWERDYADELRASMREADVPDVTGPVRFHRPLAPVHPPVEDDGYTTAVSR